MPVESKYQNDVNLKNFKSEVKKHKNLIEQLFLDFDKLNKNTEKLFKNKRVECLIYATTITFREGRGSVKNISGYSTGYKISGKNSKTLLTPLKLPPKTTKTLSKEQEVVLSACYFMLNAEKRVKTESDKTEKVETAQVGAVESQMRNLKKEFGNIRLMIGDSIYDVDDFKQVTQGRPKADMIFYNKRQPVVFVSHKKGSKPADFQQYGGFVADLNIKTLDDTKKYPGVYKFMLEADKVLKTLGVKKTDGLYDLKFTRKGFAMCDYVTDPIVANITKFGKDFPTKRMGLNNCSILIDGDFVFVPVKGKGANVFKLDGSFHSEVNPELLKRKKAYNPNPNSKYTSVLFIMRSAAQGLKQVNFFNARTVVWPNNDVAAGYLKKYKDMVRITKSKSRSGIRQLRETYEIE